MRRWRHGASTFASRDASERLRARALLPTTAMTSAPSPVFARKAL